MLDKREKQVLLFLISKCKAKQVNLIYAEDIIKAVGKTFMISLNTLQDIMLSLSRNNYLEYVCTTSKRGEGFCVSLKEKSQTYFIDAQKKKKQAWLLVLRTCALAVLSFAVGLILKGIFS